MAVVVASMTMVPSAIFMASFTPKLAPFACLISVEPQSCSPIPVGCWLTETQFFFFNSFSLEKIDLPKHPIAKEQVYVCAVFIVSRWKDSELEVSSYIVGDCVISGWTTKSLKVSKDEMIA